jgi:hypothetical protein
MLVRLERTFEATFFRLTTKMQNATTPSQNGPVEQVVGCNQVALEGYAYNAKGRVFHIAENTGILKYKMFQRGVPLDIVEPTKVKKFATEKGNASKAGHVFSIYSRNHD